MKKIFNIFRLESDKARVLHNNTKLKNSNIIPLKQKRSDVGEQKYLPSFSNEWKNTIYAYNKQELKNTPVDFMNLNKLIKGYFTLYFKNNRFIYRFKDIAIKKRRLFLKKIYVSDAEIKHSWNKAIITLYVFNPESKILRTKYKKINKIIKRTLIRKYISSYKTKITAIYNFVLDTNSRFNLNSLGLQGLEKKENFFKYALESLHANKFILLKNLMTKRLLTWFIYKYKKSNLRYLRRYDLLYSLNENKFGKSKLIPKLSSFLKNLSFFTGKTLEYNVVNLKSISYHPDLFVNALILKLTRKQLKLHHVLSRLLGMTKLPKTNLIKERTYLKNSNNLNSFINKYKDLKVISNVNKSDNLDSVLYNIYNENLGAYPQVRVNETVDINSGKSILLSSKNKDSGNEKIHPFIFNSIKYKNLAGMRLEVNGRLTKRYRADRAVHLLKWKGGLKNIDSSFKRLNTVLYRGNANSNNLYSWSKSKRRIGSFALKGWISGK